MNLESVEIGLSKINYKLFVHIRQESLGVGFANKLQIGVVAFT